MSNDNKSSQKQGFIRGETHIDWRSVAKGFEKQMCKYCVDISQNSPVRFTISDN